MDSFVSWVCINLLKYKFFYHLNRINSNNHHFRYQIAQNNSKWQLFYHFHCNFDHTFNLLKRICCLWYFLTQNFWLRISFEECMKFYHYWIKPYLVCFRRALSDLIFTRLMLGKCYRWLIHHVPFCLIFKSYLIMEVHIRYYSLFLAFFYA